MILDSIKDEIDKKWTELLNQGVTSTHFDSSEVLWCSGYHVCFTRRRSRVRTSSEPVLSLSYFHTSTCSVWLHCHQYSR